MAPSGLTGVLITKCQPNVPSTAPEGYFLTVEILGSGIQSVPEQAVKDAWGSGFSINQNGTLNVPQS